MFRGKKAAPYSENMLPAELARYLSQIILGMVGKKQTKSGRWDCLDVVLHLCLSYTILPSILVPNLCLESWALFTHSPVFCFLAKTPCNISSYCQHCCVSLDSFFFFLNDVWTALISPKYKPRCCTCFVSQLTYELMGKSASSEESDDFCFHSTVPAVPLWMLLPNISPR